MGVVAHEGLDLYWVKILSHDHKVTAESSTVFQNYRVFFRAKGHSEGKIWYFAFRNYRPLYYPGL